MGIFRRFAGVTPSGLFVSPRIKIASGVSLTNNSSQFFITLAIVSEELIPAEFKK